MPCANSSTQFTLGAHESGPERGSRNRNAAAGTGTPQPEPERGGRNRNAAAKS